MTMAAMRPPPNVLVFVSPWAMLPLLLPLLLLLEGPGSDGSPPAVPVPLPEVR
jgi:hypothetical protein